MEKAIAFFDTIEQAIIYRNAHPELCIFERQDGGPNTYAVTSWNSEDLDQDIDWLEIED